MPEALNLDPDDPKAYYDRGTALIQKGSLDEALIAFDAAIELDPTFLDAYRASTPCPSAASPVGPGPGLCGIDT